MKNVEFMEGLIAAVNSDTKNGKMNWKLKTDPKFRVKYQDSWCNRSMATCRQKGDTGHVILKISWLTTDSGTMVDGTTTLEVMWRLSRKETLGLSESVVIYEKRGSSNKDLTALRNLVDQKIREDQIDQRERETTQTGDILSRFFNGEE